MLQHRYLSSLKVLGVAQTDTISAGAKHQPFCI